MSQSPDNHPQGPVVGSVVLSNTNANLIAREGTMKGESLRYTHEILDFFLILNFICNNPEELKELKLSQTVMSRLYSNY